MILNISENLKKVLDFYDIKEYYIMGSYVRHLLTDNNDYNGDIDIFIPLSYEICSKIVRNEKSFKTQNRRTYFRIKTPKFDFIFYDEKIIKNFEEICFSSTIKFEHFYIDKNSEIHYNKNLYDNIEEIKNEILNKEAYLLNNDKLRMFNSLNGVLAHIKKYKNKGYKIIGKLNKQNYL